MLKVNAYAGIGLLLANVTTAQANTEPVFLSFYPECGYEVVETIKYRTMVELDFAKTPLHHVSHSLSKLRPEMLENASQKGIKYMVIQDLRLIPARDGAIRFQAEIEHLETCVNPYGLEGKPTPFNEKGQQQALFGTIKAGQSKIITFEPEFINNYPDFGEDVDISLTTGIYGSALGTSKTAIIDRFGPPAFRFSPGNNSELFAYGRRHWLTFQDNKLVKARYGNTFFSNELINYFVFDDRFDDRQWRIEGEVERDAILSLNANETIKPVTYTNAQQTLSAITEIFLEKDQVESKQRAVGFELTLKNKEAPEFPFSDNQKQKNQILLHDTLTKLNEEENLNAAIVRDKALGRTNKENGMQYLMLDDATLVKTLGDAINKIYLSTSLIRSQNSPWQFGEFYSGQNMKEVLQITNNAGTYIDGVLTVEKDRYSMVFYADSQNGIDKLDAAEISVH